MKQKERPRDMNQLAKLVVDQSLRKMAAASSSWGSAAKPVKKVAKKKSVKKKAAKKNAKKAVKKK